MIFIKINYKKYHLALILFFIVGCDENLIYSRSKTDEAINKFCLTPEPNVSLDINKYLPFESSMESPIEKNLGIKVSDFYNKIQKSTSLNNMNVYENQGYIDIVDDNYDVVGKILIISAGTYVKYINFEVRSDPQIFKGKLIKSALIDVISAVSDTDSELIYDKVLSNLINNIKDGKFNPRTGIYSGSFDENEVVYEVSTINKKFIAAKVASGEIKDIDCKTKKYNEYKDLELSLFSIFKH
ncbi:hypothetical protein [Acinetobacter sp. AG3]|jgi:hypothetical protein|uniref:hypothetical protein n=1 Tax=Acinetobacter sp. AG3 TaxID=2912245 RepID=UPI001EF0E390|nr:hypothetical protein [Acinetobacter sp. AG3]MCG7219399.1 hypothetical protein [Acinetobacter sp. AG3]